MACYRIMNTAFIQGLEERDPSLSHILGQRPSDLLSCRLEKESLLEDSYFYVFSAALAAMPEEILSDFVSNDCRMLADKEGEVCALKLNAGEQAPNFEIYFEDYFQLLTLEDALKAGNALADEDEDELDEEVFMDEEAERAREERMNALLPSWMGELQVGDFYSIQSMRDLVAAEADLAFDIQEYWLSQGVRIDGETSRIGYEVQLGTGSHIEDGVVILGQTTIGEDCLIESGSRIYDSKLGKGVRVRSSVIESSTMADGSNIGPFSHLRPGAQLGEGVHIGNFVEVKKASLGPGTKAGHLAYIGDAQVGADVNISCGVIFCNYDGKNKHQTQVGDHAFLGSNANLVAPVTVAEEGFVAAGSTITRAVGQGELALERAQQKNIPGYVEAKKKKGEL